MTDSEASAALHLLLVEDDDGDAVLVEELLHDAGIDTDVTRAWSLEAALDALVMPVDCILLDLGLPDASGLDALLQLRSASSAAVVVLTGLDDADRGLEAVGAGADDYLVKGTVGGEALGRALRYAVERRRGDHEKRNEEERRAHVEAVSSLASALRPSPRLSGAPVRVLVRSNDGGPLSPHLCDVVERPDGSVLSVTGTAAGSGPAAAALAVNVRAAFRALALSELPVPEVLTVLDRLAAAHEGVVNAVVVELAPGSREAVCHLAGHHAPLLLSADAVPLSAAGDRGAPLGAGPGARPVVRTHLRAQDRLLVLHTAVLDQAANAAPEGSSLGTVLEAASRGTGDDAALADTVERAVRAYGPDGQVELTLLGWTPA
ncbi:SpoIIE family protein phosphatase [Georgenia satyanarayanai]|uniref:SpoIIE family protein phosphatase n=1 Tax=Georgenia satyanarayanai TaxID=860221 RepID=UPI00203FAE0E|nr:SpoIIE family protein phosphatase [Georgenia satyanarayanai]MCM3661820.1 SpoIIE family protein phosphatase [Georgenia satyanarayanai]